jgi:hypothetical protein
MSTWQTIDSAPRDGTRVLLTSGGDVAVGQWLRDSGISDWTDESCPIYTDGPGAAAGWWDTPPTHWMPLPAPPLPGESNARFIAGPHKETR